MAPLVKQLSVDSKELGNSTRASEMGGSGDTNSKSKVSFANRRFSPRLRKTAKEQEKPTTMSEMGAGADTISNSKVSPEASATRRFSPRLRDNSELITKELRVDVKEPEHSTIVSNTAPAADKMSKSKVKHSPESSSMKRRFSPWLREISGCKVPYDGSCAENTSKELCADAKGQEKSTELSEMSAAAYTKSKSEVRHYPESSMKRRFSPRLRQTSENKGYYDGPHIESISKKLSADAQEQEHSTEVSEMGAAAYTKSKKVKHSPTASVEMRCCPRLREIGYGERSYDVPHVENIGKELGADAKELENSTGVNETGVAADRKRKIKHSAKFNANRRFSPRLREITVSKTPSDGCWVENISKEIGGDAKERENSSVVSEIGAAADTMSKSKVKHSSISSVKRRCSPCLREIPESKRLREVPESERLNYGPSIENISKAPNADAKEQENSEEASEIRVAAVTKSRGKAKHSPKSSAERRFSPRLLEIHANRTPYDGSVVENASKEHNADATEGENPTKVSEMVAAAGTKSKSKVECASKSSSKRRFSPRLREIPESNRPSYGFCVKNISNELNAGVKDRKNSTEASRTSASAPVREKKLLHYGTTSHVTHTPNDIARVKETLRIYNKYCLHFVQTEGACENDGSQSTKHLGFKIMSKKNDACEINGKRFCRHPDLKAVSKMVVSNEILFPTKRVGHLPGIEVGHQFYSRGEMMALGFYNHWFDGIDYMGQSYSKMEEFKGYKFPLAVAIVVSGQYKDGWDNSEEIVYTVKGGNDLLSKKHELKNQEMSRGNLALKHSMQHSTAVRVVRGCKAGHNSSIVYTYVGLYKVREYWCAKGVSCSLVYKYRLKQLEGQPKLTSSQVPYSKGFASKVANQAPRLVCQDITQGQEDKCIPVTNSIDDTTITGFTYTKYNQVLSNLTLPPAAIGCQCKGYCTNPKTCACAKLNGTDFPYVRNNGGRLLEAKDVVFECGPNCGCGPGCINRISQQGIKYQLEVFRTSNRGWAVKTRDFIPSGAPVCEYIGELRKTNELDNVAENDYIFEIDCLQTMKEVGGRERRFGDVSASISLQLGESDEKVLQIPPEPEFCIDGNRIGNIGRFINHSCEPNLFAQCILSSHHDPRLARIVLFASDDIPPMQELTYDYGYALDSVVDKNGNVRVLPCHCGTPDCRKRLY